MGNTTLRNARKIFTGSGGDSSLPNRVLNLENNEYKITYYEIISGASGSITLPTGATINAGEFGLSGNCILSKIDGSNKPTFESPKTSGGTIVTASLNETTGAWVASGTYTDTDVALIYSIKIKAVNYSNLDYDFIVETVADGSGYIRNLTSDAQTQLDGKTPLALRAYVSGGDFTTTSLTLVDITGLSIALEANSVYEIDIKLTYESSSNAGLNTGVNFSAVGATIEAGEVGSRDGEVGKVARITAFNTSGASTSFIRLSGTPQTHEIKGIVRTGANAGDLTAQIVKTSSGTATVYIDSYIRAQKV